MNKEHLVVKPVGPQDANAKTVFKMAWTPLEDGGISFDISSLSDEIMEFVVRDAIRLNITQEEYLRNVFIKALVSGSLTLDGWKLPPIEQTKPAIPYSPNPFPEGEDATVPNNPFAHVFMSAVFNGGPLAKLKGWEESTADGSPKYEKENIGSQGALWRTVVDTQARHAAELWALVHRLGTLHAQVGMYILAKMGDKRNGVRYPLKEIVMITAEEFLQLKGVQRRGNDRRLLLKDVGQAIRDLSELTTDVREIWIPGQKTPSHIPRARLFNIDEYYEQLDFGNGIEQPVAWGISGGAWTQYYFADGTTAGWVSNMSRVLLQLDSSGNKKAEALAFKIGTMFLVVAGGTDFKNRTLTPTVAQVLTKVGEFLDEANRGPHWAGRMYETLGLSLEALQSGGVLASFSYGPTYPDAGDKGRGWVERWLDATVHLTAPDAQAEMEKVANGTAKPRPRIIEWKKKQRQIAKKTRKPLEPGQNLDGETIAAIRKKTAEANLSITTLARELKVAQGTLSNVLNRKYAPSPELAARIKTFLDSPIED